MSWSISRDGAPAELAKAIREDSAFANELASTAEESVRASAVAAVLAAIEANRDATSVTVSAYGSQTTYQDGNSMKKVQSVNISVSATA